MDEQQRYWKRSGQIPAFGNWENANDLPITQYFECARQAGLLRFSNSSGECNFHLSGGGGGDDGDLYAVDFKKHPLRATGFPPKTRRENANCNKRCPQVKEQKRPAMRKNIKHSDGDVTKPPVMINQVSSQKINQRPIKKCPAATNATVVHTVSRQPPATTKPVDEDLYKIPPDLVRASKRKKRLGLFSRCLVPACMV